MHEIPRFVVEVMQYLVGIAGSFSIQDGNVCMENSQSFVLSWTHGLDRRLVGEDRAPLLGTVPRRREAFQNRAAGTKKIEEIVQWMTTRRP